MSTHYPWTLHNLTPHTSRILRKCSVSLHPYRYRTLRRRTILRNRLTLTFNEYNYGRNGGTRHRTSNKCRRIMKLYQRISLLAWILEINHDGVIDVLSSLNSTVTILFEITVSIASNRIGSRIKLKLIITRGPRGPSSFSRGGAYID